MLHCRSDLLFAEICSLACLSLFSKKLHTDSALCNICTIVWTRLHYLENLRSYYEKEISFMLLSQADPFPVAFIDLCTEDK